jgi:hypothetical protein
MFNMTGAHGNHLSGKVLIKWLCGCGCEGRCWWQWQLHALHIAQTAMVHAGCDVRSLLAALLQ